MPYIEFHIAAGLTKARKTQLIRDIVKVTHESIGSDPKIINVLLFEHPADNMRTNSRRGGSEAGRGEDTSLNLGSRRRPAQPRRPEPDRLRMESSFRAMHSASGIAGFVLRHAHQLVFLKSVERSR